MDKNTSIWYNGNIINWDDAKVHNVSCIALC